MNKTLTVPKYSKNRKGDNTAGEWKMPGKSVWKAEMQRRKTAHRQDMGLLVFLGVFLALVVIAILV